MNVAQLIEALSDFGDHLPVAIEIDKGETSVFRTVESVETGDDSRTGDLAVIITVPL